MHKEYLLTENQSLAHHFLSKTKTTPSFLQLQLGGGGWKKTTSADEDFEQWDQQGGMKMQFLRYSWGLGIQARGNTRRGAWRMMFLLCVIFITAGKNGPHNGPELDGPLLGEFFATHSITSFANIVFGAIKRILSIAITVESAIRVESKDIHWSRDVLHWLHCPFFFGLICLWNIYGPNLSRSCSSFEDHQMAVCSS